MFWAFETNKNSLFVGTYVAFTFRTWKTVDKDARIQSKKRIVNWHLICKKIFSVPRHTPNCLTYSSISLVTYRRKQPNSQFFAKEKLYFLIKREKIRKILTESVSTKHLLWKLLHHYIGCTSCSCPQLIIIVRKNHYKT